MTTPGPGPERPPVGRSVLWIVVSQVAVLPLGLVQGMILARHLGPVGLGRYSLLLTDVNLWVTLASVGLPGALAVLLSEAPRRLRALLRLGLRFGLLSLGLPALLLVGLAWRVPAVPALLGHLPIELTLVAVLASVQYLRDNLSALQLGTQQFGAQNRQTVTIAVLQLGLCLALLLFQVLTSYTALCIPLAGNAILCLLAGRALWRVARAHDLWRPDGEEDLRARALRIGLRNFLHIVPDLLLLRIDVYLLQHLAPAGTGGAELGLYQAGVRIAELVLMLPSALNAVLFAKAAGKEDLRAVTIAGAKLSLALGLCCLVGMVLVGRPLLILFYGARFAGSFVPCVLVLAGCCAMCYSTPLGGTLAGDGAYPRSVIIAQGTALLVNVGANLLLIPRYGAVGAAAASTLAYTVSAAVLTLAFALRFEVSAGELLRPESPLALLRRVRRH